MTALVAATLLLSVLGLNPIEGAEGVKVAFSTGGPADIRGVACDPSFEVVDGHAQSLCEGMPPRSIILYVDEIEPTVAAWHAVILHEWCHLELGVVDGATPWERFSEAECYDRERNATPEQGEQ